MVVCDNGSGLIRHRNLVSSCYTIYMCIYICACICNKLMHVRGTSIQICAVKKGEITNYQVKVKFYFESRRIRDLFSEVNSHKN